MPQLLPSSSTIVISAVDGEPIITPGLDAEALNVRLKISGFSRAMSSLVISKFTLLTDDARELAGKVTDALTCGPDSSTNSWTEGPEVRESLHSCFYA